MTIDDYGTGFSSITHLQQLPIDIIKIDRSIASDFDDTMDYIALNAGIIEMAHRMNMEVVAEGIAKESDWNKLVELNATTSKVFSARSRFRKLSSKFYGNEVYPRTIRRNNAGRSQQPVARLR